MHEHYMQLALQEAEKGRYFTKPNPAVGCIIVKNGQILATGFHQGPGTEHAEIAALKKINFDAKNCDLYVNLEPCAHHGQTPPCVDTIIQSGINRVIIPFIDPNPFTRGKSIQKLKNHNIEVITNIQQASAHTLNRFFLHYMNTNRPFIIAKWAMTPQRQLTPSQGQWISHPESRAHTHLLRQQTDAILIGANTLRKDNPSLTTRVDFLENKQIKHPLRIVLTTQGDFDLSYRLLNDEHTENTLIACMLSPTANLIADCQEKKINLLTLSGKTTLEKLQSLIDYLGQKQIMSLIIEGGEMVLKTFFENDLIDEVQCYIADKSLHANNLNQFIAQYTDTRFSISEKTLIATDTFIRANKELPYV